MHFYLSLDKSVSTLKPVGTTKSKTDAGAFEQALALGEVRVRVLCVKFVGLTTLLLTVGGLAMFYFAPDQAKTVWPSIQPILTLALSGLLAFWAATRRRRA